MDARLFPPEADSAYPAAPFSLVSVIKADRVLRLKGADGRGYVLKTRPKPEKVPGEFELLSFLSAHGVPCETIVLTRDDKPSFLSGSANFALYNEINGIPVKDRFSTEHMGALFGHALSRLHKALALKPIRPNDPKVNLLEEMDTWILPSLVKHIFDTDKLDIFRKTRDYLKQHYAALPYQYIHRDPHEGNILFNGDELAGFVDFELAHHSIRIFDLCYFCTGMLQEGFYDKAKRDAWKGLAVDFISAYHDKNPLTPDEILAIRPIMLAIEMLFLAFWSGKENRKLFDENLAMFDFVLAIPADEFTRPFAT